MSFLLHSLQSPIDLEGGMGSQNLSVEAHLPKEFANAIDFRTSLIVFLTRQFNTEIKERLLVVYLYNAEIKYKYGPILAYIDAHGAILASIDSYGPY